MNTASPVSDTPWDGGGPDSAYAWMRLLAALAISTIGGVGMWSVVVALPALQAEFGVHRGDAALPYTLVMMGLVVGGVVMGRLADRFGISMPVAVGGVALGLGYIAAAYAESIWQFALVHGLLIGLLGSSATFGPVIADISLWFVRRRGAAVAIVACGSYLAGAIWPPVAHHFIETVGWRQTHVGIGLFCLVTMLPLALAMRRRAPALRMAAPAAGTAGGPRRALSGVSPTTLQALLMLAGLACCVAMSMPQVHIVAYCGDLGYGTARGAEMLSLMLGAGVVSRLVFGWVADRIGAVPTLLIGSALQAVSLLLFLPFDGLVSLYLLSALFGLFQGGIVPAYAMIVRENFPPGQVSTRVSLVLSATLAGMALGGWMSGAIFDLTLSYNAAFLNGFLWNLVNLAIVAVLLRQWLRSGTAVRAAHASSGSA